MVVDDDMINMVVAEQMLRSQQWKVAKANDGFQCLEMIEKAAVLPDMILLGEGTAEFKYGSLVY